ncbi:helix-turn-helix domain-containing protein [Alkalihalobacillus clausii]|nr:helix-turn-helix domain-containing protein [Shouchella clausii]MBU3262749.1 helix-turn-helix domain-containing protein [Shouchella clausii]MBU3506935.1 helix-turn-helix domain-containing protein [Shouchella clausii]MBU3535502.1 helix-turn-helix domain-containing protein [Shouchella clausii]MBX0306678.1 helix-turn-helix domain-containing protein [Shouchella clausii]
MEAMTRLGLSLRQIAKNLGQSPSTISRERRYASGKTSYQSEKAHEMAQAGEAHRNQRRKCLQ